jgi:hypothetical protein
VNFAAFEPSEMASLAKAPGIMLTGVWASREPTPSAQGVHVVHVNEPGAITRDSVEALRDERVAVLELAGNATRDDKKTRISPRIIMLAIRSDKELNQLLSNITIASAAVVPHTHKVLLVPGKSKNEEQTRSAPPRRFDAIQWEWQSELRPFFHFPEANSSWLFLPAKVVLESF